MKGFGSLSEYLDLPFVCKMCAFSTPKTYQKADNLHIRKIQVCFFHLKNEGLYRFPWIFFNPPKTSYGISVFTYIFLPKLSKCR